MNLEGILLDRRTFLKGAAGLVTGCAGKPKAEVTDLFPRTKVVKDSGEHRGRPFQRVREYRTDGTLEKAFVVRNLEGDRTLSIEIWYDANGRIKSRMSKIDKPIPGWGSNTTRYHRNDKGRIKQITRVQHKSDGPDTMSMKLYENLPDDSEMELVDGYIKVPRGAARIKDIPSADLNSSGVVQRGVILMYDDSGYFLHDDRIIDGKLIHEDGECFNDPDILYTKDTILHARNIGPGSQYLRQRLRSLVAEVQND